MDKFDYEQFSIDLIKFIENELTTHYRQINYKTWYGNISNGIRLNLKEKFITMQHISAIEKYLNVIRITSHIDPINLEISLSDKDFVNKIAKAVL